MKRSEAYADIADKLSATCIATIDNDAMQTCGEEHGKLWDGTLYYCAGEWVRVRGLDLANIHGKNFLGIISLCLNRAEEKSVLINCFAAMGLGMLGPADDRHPVLRRAELRERANRRLVVDKSYDNNWEAFNASIRIGRSLLFGDDPALMLPHLEKMNRKYLDGGYFDDSKNCGVYNNYGLMTLNYSLRAVEFLEPGHPVRQQVENWFRPHALRYVRLLKDFIHKDGMGWVFGRSAGVLGQLQCLVLLEQVLSKGWLDPADAAWARRACRQLLRYMCDVFWDDEFNWFSFRDRHRSCYNYRTTLPMAWDLLRYFLQMEDYARVDERSGGDELTALPAEAMCKEIITHPRRHTAYLVWSNGDMKWQMPVMGGPGWVSADTMPRPFLPGLFEWCTGSKIPVMCPRLRIAGQDAWPAWWPAATRLEADGDNWRYHVRYDHLVGEFGDKVNAPVSAEVCFHFGDGFFERHDVFHVEHGVSIDHVRLEVLQGTAHPKSRQYPRVYTLECSLETTFAGCTISIDDVSHDDNYRNYYSHPSKRWFLDGTPRHCESGDYRIVTSITWDPDAGAE